VNEDLSMLRGPDRKTPLQAVESGLAGPDGTVYPIVNGIPRFVSADNYAQDFGDQWNRFPKTQLDSHSGITITEDRLARCLRGELTELRGKRVLEAGSGAGRFTEVLLKHGARLDSFDFSSAVEANARNNGDNPSLTLVQADIRRIPFAEAAYDYVVCLGVLQHTPNPEESIESLWRMVKPGGRLVVDHYRWNLWLRLPPPIGDAEKAYRRLVLMLPRHRRFAAVEKLTRFWFPIYWKFRDSRLARKILARIGGIHFYYPIIDLPDRQSHYEWSLLDTHDGMTDHFKHYRNERQIEDVLKRLGAEDLHVGVGGNGVEAYCRKPVRP
jgi:SAM-dependent methyltransferase